MSRSQQLFARAVHCIPGGVNSPVRAFGGVGGNPLFFCKGEGAYLVDVDGHRYIDYVGSWGSSIVGHANPKVVSAVSYAAARGLSFGAPTENEICLAEKIIHYIPSIEQIRLVNSGTEATMSAIRLARAVTGRSKIIKFAGCYHGHADSLLVNAGSGALTFGTPSSPGVPESLAEQTCVAEYNDLESVKNWFERCGDDIAAIIVEPVAGNMNCVLPIPGFLSGLRALCDRYRSILIFDEVMTGFRVQLGGAQAYYDVKPDLTTLGKVIGGGMPIGAFGGARAIMEQLAPIGKVYQAGTLSGNPLAVAAGLATLKIIEQPGFYPALQESKNYLIQGMIQKARQAGVPFQATGIGGMFGLFFTARSEPITGLAHVMESNVPQFQRFFHHMLAQGIYLAPSAYEAGFVSAAHTEEQLDETLAAAEKAFRGLQL